MGLLSTIGDVFKAVNPFAGLIGTGVDFITGKSAQKQASKQFQAGSMTARVNEARKLGIHPLVALGMQPQPGIVAGQTGLGSSLKQGIAQAAQAGKKPDVQGKAWGNLQNQADLRLKNAAASRDEAEAKLALSRIATGATAAGSNTGFNGQMQEPIEGQVIHKPVEVPSTQVGDASTAAGQQPFFAKYTFAQIGGKKIPIYGPRSDEPAEAFENIMGTIISIPKNALELGKWAGSPYYRAVKRAYNKLKSQKGIPTGTRRSRRIRR